MLKKKELITKESGLTLQVYNFRQCFLVRVHQAFLPLSLFLNPKSPNHTQQPNNNTLPHNIALYLFQTTGQVTSFSGSLCCSGLQHTLFLRLTTVYFLFPPHFVFSGLLCKRKLLAHQAFFPTNDSHSYFATKRYI